jgi:hypothetical protein
MPSEANYPAILERPIFAPDRAPILLAAQSSGNLAGYNVVGTAIAGTTSTALVRDMTGRVIRVKPDATLQGWRLVSIERSQLIFDRDGERRSLPVEAAGGGAALRGPPGAMGGPAGVMTGQPAASSDKSKDDDDDDDDDSDDDN